MIDLTPVREHVKKILSDLPSSLTYHNKEHTLDVANQCMKIANEEGITNEDQLMQLEIAALYHDTGFLTSYKGHEEKGCEWAKKELPSFGLDKISIDIICDIILATRVPQKPKNILQQIICDADLDYLGRYDFFFISENLHKEFIYYNICQNEKEWQKSRIEFLQSHTYFTKSSQRRRMELKVSHLAQLKVAYEGSLTKR